MAQVLLPCFLPSWPTVHDQIMAIENCQHVPELLRIMGDIQEISNVGLDPEEHEQCASTEGQNKHLFEELHQFILNDLSAIERQHFMTKTIKSISGLARNLKGLRPPNGLKFFLQQQASTVDLDHQFVGSLLANAFLSTFPTRTIKTHPTLQNFNFTFFFKGLRDSALQQAKLKSLLKYFDWISEIRNQESQSPPLRISRKVMGGKQWLTVEDWNECIIPLCRINIKHDKNIESSAPDVIQIVFASPRIGGEVLGETCITSQESLQLMTCPELLVTMLFVEALEDNESLSVENCYQVARISAPKQKAIFESLDPPRLLNFGCMDAECYSHLVVDQFEEDNFLRELNKVLLTFHQNMSEFTSVQDYMKDRRARRLPDPALSVVATRRLSPIGERTKLLVHGASSSTPASVDTDSELVINNRRSWLTVKDNSRNDQYTSSTKGKFIVLGSSGERLPVNRLVNKAPTGSVDQFSSCETSSESSEEFHSAKGSVEEVDEEESFAEKYLHKLYSPEKRFDFARRLRDALHEHSQGSMLTDSTDDDSYQAGAISVKGPDVHDMDRIRIKRRGSDGFVLQEDSSFDEDLLQELIMQVPGRERGGNSSKYSFSTDLSELSEFCEQLTTNQVDVSEINLRDKDVLHFATSILKRGLSESVVGCGEFPASETENKIFPCDFNNNEQYSDRLQNVYNNNSRSLSVELVQQKHKLAAKLISEILQNRADDKIGSGRLRKIGTGNWGCGKDGGDVQLKFIIQWMAASLSGVPILIYHTAGHEKLAKLDTVCRILRDRKWSVGRLARSTLKCNQYFLENPAQFLIEGTEDKDFFDRLLGIDRG